MISPVSPLACGCVRPGDAHPPRAAPKRPENRRPSWDAVSPVVAPRARTRCWAAARVSRSNMFHDRADAHRLAVPTGELDPGILHGSDELRASLLGNSAAQSIGELLLFVQGKPVCCIQSRRERSHNQKLDGLPRVFNFSLAGLTSRAWSGLGIWGQAMNASRGFLELLVCAFHPTSRPVAAHPDGDASTPLIRSNAWEIPPPSGQGPWRPATCTRAQAATAKVCLRRLHLRRRPTNVFGLPPRTRPAVKNSYQRQFNFSIYGSCERERAAVRRSPGYQQTLVSCFVSAPNPRSSASAKPDTCKRPDLARRERHRSSSAPRPSPRLSRTAGGFSSVECAIAELSVGVVAVYASAVVRCRKPSPSPPHPSTHALRLRTSPPSPSSGPPRPALRRRAPQHFAHPRR